MEFQYKCVLVPEAIETEKSHEEAVRYYEKLINNNAAGGWEYKGIDIISSVRKAGCFGSLLGKKDEEISLKFIVYQKPK